MPETSRDLCDLEFVDVGMHGSGEVLRDELVGAAVFADERGLPGEEVGDAHLLPARPLELVSGADGAVAGGHVLPAVDVLAPVVEAPGFVEGVGGAELLLEVIDEADEDVVVGGVVGVGFVVDLPADDGGVVAVVLDHVADEALGVVAIDGAVDVHVLAHAVEGFGAAKRAGEDFGMRVVQPGGDGVGGRAHDDLDAGLAHGIDDAVHPGVFEVAVFRLPEAPGGFAHAHDGEAGLLHQGDVFVEALVGVVFAVVGGAVKDGGEVRRLREAGARLRRAQKEASEQEIDATKSF